MNAVDIEKFLHIDPVFRIKVQGVFSADMLPSEPRLLICNTDPSTKAGEHWIAIHVDEYGRGEYFDSFGRPPNEHFTSYKNKHCSLSWNFNKRQLQSIISSFCGHYTCFYCMLRSRGVDMLRIVKHFTSDTGFNDSIVHGFVCNKMY